MANPNNGRYNEWIELYNDENENISLINWEIGDLGKNRTFSLNISAHSFGLIVDDSLNISSKIGCSAFNISNENCVELTEIGDQLSNSKDSVLLFNDSFELINNFSYNITHSGLSWQYCSSGWIENIPTPSSQNNCTTQQNNSTNSTEPQISLDMDWDEDDIINGEEFEIEVKAFNLENEEYNLKIWIKFDDNDTCISDRYGENNEGEEKWLSGKSYWIYNIFEGPKNKTESIKLRIRDDYKNVHGDDFEICLELEDVEDTEKCESIEILEKEEESEEEETDSNEATQTTSETTPTITGEVIRLGSSEPEAKIENATVENNNLIYESRNELIKKYSIFGFAIFCVALNVLLIFNKIK